MKRRSLLALTIVLFIALTFLVLQGCGGGATEETGKSSQTVSESETGSTTPADPSRAVLMNGRSVGYNWMAYWGYPGSGSVQKEGYTISYKELDGSDIASSFAQNVEGLPQGSVVFFKFCFVDFDGSNLTQREKELDQVIATAEARGLKLIIGNALPVRKQDGSSEIVEEEKAFNAYAEQKAAAATNVWVLDMHGVLADADGYLKREYQTGDSHPNDAAYAAMDEVFFPLLAEVFAGTRP